LLSFDPTLQPQFFRRAVSFEKKIFGKYNFVLRGKKPF